MTKHNFKPFPDLRDDIKEKANALLGSINGVPSLFARERALAITKLEECVMWALKGLDE